MEAFKIEKMGVSLIGEVVPLEARIIAVADSFDAMTSLRPHRRALPLEEVFARLEKGKGKQFDSNIVEIFLREKVYDASKNM
jgi:putative two-component system response regulator